MRSAAPEAVVAGHICLDIIPQIPAAGGAFAARLRPGALVEIGPAVLSTGGAVSNTGLALHRLGVATQLMGKVGDDRFGELVLALLRQRGAGLAEGMLVAAGAHTSYTVVLNPPDADRTFLHCSGANDTLCAADIPTAELAGARLFHFGYPPILRQFCADEGAQLEQLFRAVGAGGVVRSLDMSMPDPNGPSGAVPWRAVLRRTLPLVDVFLPSLDEILFMLGRPAAERFDAALLSDVGAELLELGAAIVGLKLGSDGLYVRATGDGPRLRGLSGRLPGLERWRGRELYTPCCEVAVAGTTGCGDATIAGFLAALVRGVTPEEALAAAVGVGACCAERPDATSGLRAWDEVRARLAAGWRRRAPATGTGWAARGGVYCGPHDA